VKEVIDYYVEAEEQEPNPMYFMPAATFLIFVINAAFGGNTLNAGLWSAWMGISIITPLIYTMLVGVGLVTDNYLDVRVKKASIASDFLLGFIALNMVQITVYLIGQANYWIPSFENMGIYLLGFLTYQVMKAGFNFVFEQEQLSLRVRASAGMVVVIVIGFISIAAMVAAGVL
jgi:hypothetical protein